MTRNTVCSSSEPITVQAGIRVLPCHGEKYGLSGSGLHWKTLVAMCRSWLSGEMWALGADYMTT
jgi:hypothetical protein